MSIKGIAIKSMNLSNAAYSHTKRGNHARGAQVLLELRDYLIAKNFDHAGIPRESSESQSPAVDSKSMKGKSCHEHPKP